MSPVVNKNYAFDWIPASLKWRMHGFLVGLFPVDNYKFIGGSISMKICIAYYLPLTHIVNPIQILYRRVDLVISLKGLGDNFSLIPTTA